MASEAENKAIRSYRAGLFLSLTAAFVLIQLIGAGLMIARGDIPAFANHILLSIVMSRLFFWVYSVYSANCAAAVKTDYPLFWANDSFWLMVGNLSLILLIAVHDLDHVRQAMEWGYMFEVELLVVNTVVQVPGAVGMVVAAKQTYLGAIVTSLSGPLVAILFLKTHLTGPSVPVWGPWNKTFFELGADKLSWWVLAITAFVATCCGMVGIYFLGVESGRRGERKRLESNGSLSPTI